MLSRSCFRAAHCAAPRAARGISQVTRSCQASVPCTPRSKLSAGTPPVKARKQQRYLHVTCAAKAATEQLPASLKKIVGAFQMVPDPMARYKQLLFYATKLPPMAAADHTPSNKVEGCVSQVWVKPELRADGKVYWTADSDSALTKGLAALLVLGLSGCTPQEVVQVDAGFIELLGLKQSLTPSRNNGFLNMLRLMQRKTLELMASSEGGQAAGTSAVANGNASTSQQATQATPSSTSPAVTPAAAAANGSSGQAEAAAAAAAERPEPAQSAGSGPASASSPVVGAAAASSPGASSSSRTPVQDGIRSKLTQALKPVELRIIDESAMHAGHAAMRAVAGKAGGSGETHFKVEVVSAEFEGLPLVKRQRWVYQLLQDEFGMGLHALSLQTKTPAEVEASR